MRFRTLVVAASIIVLLGLVLSTSFYLKRSSELSVENIQSTANQAINQLAYSEREYQIARAQLVSISELLASGQPLRDYIAKDDQQSRMRLEKDWLSVISGQSWYSELSYFDAKGRTQVLVRFFSSNSGPETHFRDRANYRRFQYARMLKRGEVGVWQDTPTAYKGKSDNLMHLITPVYTDNRRNGYVALTLDFTQFASQLNYSPIEGLKPQLVSFNGDFVSNWQCIEQQRTCSFADRYPKTWHEIQSEFSGYRMEHGSLIAFTQLHLFGKNPAFLVIEVDEQTLSEKARPFFEDLFQEASILFLLILSLVLPTCLAVMYYRRRSLEAQLAQAALRGMSAVLIADKHHKTLMVNEEFTKLTGLLDTKVKSQNAIKALLADQPKVVDDIFTSLMLHDQWQGEIAFTRKDGSKVTAIMRIQNIRDKKATEGYYTASLVNITDRKALELQLRELSEKDALTTLWNRRKFELRMREIAKLVERYPLVNKACLALLDIDHFKRVNDKLGHDEGDRVITQVAEIMQQTMRETDFIYRIGGEEFAIIMPHACLDDAVGALDRLRQNIANKPDLGVTISVGCTDFIPDSAASYKNADVALYESKTMGRNRVTIITSEEEVA